MLPRLLSDEQLRSFKVLLAANERHMPDAQQREFLNELEQRSAGELVDRRQRPPRITRAQLAGLRINMRPPGERKEVSAE